MPQYMITAPDGRKYRIAGDTPEGAKSALDQHLAGSASSAPEPAVDSSARMAISNDYQDAIDPAKNAQKKYDELPEWAKPFVAAQDLLNVGVNGVTFGYGDKAVAKADELIGRGTYDEQLAKRRTETEASRSRAGIPGMVAEIGGSILPVARLAQAGVTATRVPGVLGRYGGAAVDGAAFGALTAAGHDQDMLSGAGLGAVLGPVGQAAGDVVSTVARPVTSRMFPDDAASRVMAGAMDEAKLTPVQVADDIARARADGQTSYAVADAMGYPGQRLVSTVVRTPNEGRAPMVEFLEQRQAGQGRRIQSALEDGFGNPSTALKSINDLEKARGAAGDVNYTAARESATNVDTTPVLSKIDEMLGKPPLGVSDGISPDTMAGALMRARSMLAGQGNAQRMDFSSLLRIRADLSDAADMAFNKGAKRQGSALKSVLRELDASLASASTGYRKALEQFAKDSRVIDAVDVGRASAQRGRYEDTIPAFNAMSPDEQAAFRAGYADPLIQQTQGAAVGVNKARPLINDAFDQEFPTFAAPGQADKLGRRLAREQTMFETRAAGVGGSRTADNLADEAALSAFDPSVLGNLLSGNLPGAIKNGILQAISSLRGQPPRVRELISQALRETDPVVVRRNLIKAVDRIKASDEQKQAIIRALMMASTAGLIQNQN